MSECSCSSWKENRKIIDSALHLAVLHGSEGLKKSFNFCPYCGVMLKNTVNITCANKEDMK